MPFRGEAILTVFDALGKPVAVPFNGLAGPGYHGLFWDAGTLPSGSYFLELQVLSSPNRHRSAGKMLLLR